jgi:hypothetical protein
MYTETEKEQIRAKAIVLARRAAKDQSVDLDALLPSEREALIITHTRSIRKTMNVVAN